MKKRIVVLMISAAVLRAPQARAEDPAGVLDLSSQSETGWKLTLCPYLWAPGIKGNAGVGPVTVPVDVKFTDYIGDLQGGLVLMGEAKYDRVSVMLDTIWLRLGAHATSPGALNTSADVQMDSVIVELEAAYWVVDTKTFKAAVLGGGRLMYLRQDMDLSPDYGTIGPVSDQIVETTAGKLSSAVQKGIDNAKDEITQDLKRRNGPIDDQVSSALKDINIKIDPSTALDEIAAAGGTYDGPSLSQEEGMYVDALQSAIAERAGQLVSQLSPLDRNNPDAVAKAIDQAASESVSNLKKEVSSATSKALTQAQDGLQQSITSGMVAAQNADLIASRDWVDPIVGARMNWAITGRLAINLYGDYGGFGVSSKSTWQVYGGVSWQLSENVSVNLGYRHLYIDYDRAGLKLDAAMSGGMLGVGVRL